LPDSILRERSFLANFRVMLLRQLNGLGPQRLNLFAFDPVNSTTVANSEASTKRLCYLNQRANGQKDSVTGGNLRNSCISKQSEFTLSHTKTLLGIPAE